MTRPVFVVHTTYQKDPIPVFPRRLFPTVQAKRLAKNPSVRYIVVGQTDTLRPSKSFLEKHSKKSKLLQPVPNTKKVFTLKKNALSKRYTRATKK